MAIPASRQSSSPRGLGALLMIAIGVWLFLQTSVGELVERLQSFFPGQDDPKGAGAAGSLATPSIWGRKALAAKLGVKKGDHVVYETIMPACSKAGGGFVVVSWHRPGAVTRKGKASCHRHGKKTRKGALDIVHKSGKWEPVDRLDYELKVTPGVDEVIFRGDPDHDPALGADDPHCHAAVNCG